MNHYPLKKSSLRSATVLLCVVLLVLGGFPSQSVMAQGGISDVKDRKIDNTLAQLEAEYLGYAQNNFVGGFSTSVSGLMMNANNGVAIDAASSTSGSALLSDLQALGLTNGAVAGRVVSGYLPVSAISSLDSVPSLQFAMASRYQLNVGSVTSQADSAMRASFARAEYGVDGTGVTVGVISDSFNCLGGQSADVASGDLPPDVVILEEPTCSGTIDEGRAMAQLIYDIAPGADIQFHTALGGEANFAQGIRDLRNAGSDVIVDDIIYFAEGMFQDDVVAQAADEVFGNGIPYFSSAGNSATQSYEAPFRNSGVVGSIGGRSVTYHDFDPGSGVDTTMQINLSSFDGTNIWLQWDTPHFSISGGNGARNDLDMVIEFGGSPVSTGNVSNLGGDPVENAGVTYTGGGTVAVDLRIGIAAGAVPSIIKFVDFDGSADYVEYFTNSSTSYGHANANGAAGVGAIPFYDTPAFGVSPPVAESFTSLGGVPIYYDILGGRLPSPVVRNQPRFSAPDGVNNTFFGNDTTRDDDTFPNFFGTSAAAPNAAAVAALMLECDPNLTPSQIYQVLQSTAIDANPFGETAPGYDRYTGFGLVQANLALEQVCQQTPPPGTCEPDTIGIYRDSTFRWYLRYSNSSGVADQTFGYGLPQDGYVTGDWNGDGVDTVGIYRNNTFFLVNTNGATQADIVVAYGSPGDIPIAGDWNGDGVDTIGIYRPSTAAWALRNSNTPGAPDLNFGFGLANEIPVVGDWNGDGTDTPGIYRTSDRKFFLRNSNTQGAADLSFIYGNPAEDQPIVGDWNGDCVDTIGAYRTGLARWYLRNSNDAGLADLTFNYGLANEKPVTGVWDPSAATSGFVTAMADINAGEAVVQSVEMESAPVDVPTDTPTDVPTEAPPEDDAPAALSLPASAAPDALSAMGAWALADGSWAVSGGETAALTWTQPIDLGGASVPALSFSSSLSAASATAAVQVQADGGEWTTAAVISADDSAPSIDLSAYAGQVVSVRFVWIGGDEAADSWAVSGVIVSETVPVDEPSDDDTPADDDTDDFEVVPLEPVAPGNPELGG